MKRRSLVLLPAAATLASCATSTNDKLRLPQLADAALPDRSSGVLLVRLVLNDPVPNAVQQPDISVAFARQDRFLGSDGVFDLLPGSQLKVVSLQPGTYSWTVLTVFRLVADLGGKFPFEIRAGTTTYAGDLLMSVNRRDEKYSLTRQNDSEETLRQFREAFPKVASTFPLAK